MVAHGPPLRGPLTPFAPHGERIAPDLRGERATVHVHGHFAGGGRGVVDPLLVPVTVTVAPLGATVGDCYPVALGGAVADDAETVDLGLDFPLCAALDHGDLA